MFIRSKADRYSPPDHEFSRRLATAIIKYSLALPSVAVPHAPVAEGSLTN
jgi:hypothetical protein